jgi:DNA-binding NtrC family response regulator
LLEVLVADDDENVRECVASALESAGHRVTEASDGAQAVELMASRVFDLAICDVHMPRLGGMALLRRIRREAPGTAVVIMTGFGEIPDVVGSMREGAVDFVTKPFDPDEFARTVVEPIAEQRGLRRRFDARRAAQWERHTVGPLVAESRAMRALADRIRVLARTDVPVLVSGDPGTGKERVACELHAHGPRRSGPFVMAQGTLLRENLQDIEDCVREAAGGSLVLDGMENLSLRAQVHLLRVLEAPGTLARSGPLGVRLITLTRENLPAGATSAELLDALHYRLNGMRLHVPALRERGPDLYPLVLQLIDELEPPGAPRSGVTQRAWTMLAGYAFPGNVRELKAILEHALALADGHPIDAAHLPSALLVGSTSEAPGR